MSVLVQADVPVGLRERELLEEEWDRIRSHFLPLAGQGFWCSNPAPAELPRQGWKLHVSATVLTASETLRRVGPILQARGVHFKAPRSLADLAELNCGLFQAYPQVGKFITVYPTGNAAELAEVLHAATVGLPGPKVPGEPALHTGSRVSYRYGVFRRQAGDPDDADSHLRLPDGTWVADVRDLDHAVPDWVTNPFPTAPATKPTVSTFPYLGYAALRQRGKGGTYRAQDVSQNPTRPCILKEGRRHGETDWRGVDGFERLQREAEALTILGAAGAPVPQVYGTVELDDHFYVAMQDVEGPDLQQRILSEPMPASSERLRIAVTVAQMVARIHATGLAWRDCKPGNLVLTDGGAYALDFEGACPDQDRAASGFGTRHYLPGNWMTVGAGWQPKDCFALGITLAQIMAWSLELISPREAKPSGMTAPGISNLADTYDDLMRKAGTPQQVREIVRRLLETADADRPTAAETAEALELADR